MPRAAKRSMSATNRSGFAIFAALPVSLLLAALSLGGLLSSAYAKEAPAWMAQAEAAAPVTIAMFVVAAITVVVLARVLRAPHRSERECLQFLVGLHTRFKF
jgi:hypothetical protein